MTLTSHRSLAQHYLQTVVILDDRLTASSGRTDNDVSKLDEPQPEDYDEDDYLVPGAIDDAPAMTAFGGVREPAASGTSDDTSSTGLVQGEEADSVLSGGDEQDEHGAVDGLALVDEFARIGLVCSLISPPKGQNFADKATAAISSLSQRADAFIFDWYLHGDAGGLVRELIADLLKPSDPRMARVRMIVVYTSRQDRANIRDQIAERLASADIVAIPHGIPEPGEDGPAYLEGNGFRVSVVGKPRKLSAGTSSASHLIEVTELPGWLVSEFAQVSAGLLRGVALEALSALRDNANHLLARVGPDVDPAFVSHAFLTGTGQQFAIQLINQELETLVSGSVGAPTAGVDSLAKWVRSKFEAEGFQPTIEIGASSIDVTGDAEYWLGQFRRGMDKFHKKPLPVKGDGDATKVSSFATVTSLFVDPETAKSADRSLGAMSSLARTLLDPVYSRPSLHLGTVLRDGGGSYWLCLQPVCDSVRVPRRGRRFPLSPLREVHASDEFDLVVPIPADHSASDGSAEPRWLRFKRRHHQYLTIMPVFHGDLEGFVRPTGSRPEQWRFRSKDRVVYDWIAELRPGHGQRIANDNAGQVSRVGLDEAEWLRLGGLNPQYKKGHGDGPHR